MPATIGRQLNRAFQLTYNAAAHATGIVFVAVQINALEHDLRIDRIDASILFSGVNGFNNFANSLVEIIKGARLRDNASPDNQASDEWEKLWANTLGRFSAGNFDFARSKEFPAGHVYTIVMHRVQSDPVGDTGTMSLCVSGELLIPSGPGVVLAGAQIG